MKAQLTIEVPEGDYCWKYDNSIYPCKHLDNTGGWAKCALKNVLGYSSQTEDDIGPQKLPECARLLVVDPNYIADLESAWTVAVNFYPDLEALMEKE